MWGEPRFCGVGGTLPPRLSPQGKRERGFNLPCCRRRFPLLPSPIRPASIRTLQGSFRSGASWGPQSQRVLPSQNRTDPPRSRSFRSAATSQSPEPGDWANSNTTESFRPLSPGPCFSSAARIPRRSPTNGAAGSPVFSPPPQSLFSLHSFHRALPVSCPTSSDPCPAPAPP